MMKDETLIQERQLPLEEAISKLDDVFIKGHDRELYKSIVTRIEKALIDRVLERTFGNQYRAARILGINRNTLHTKITKLGIDPRKWKE